MKYFSTLNQVLLQQRGISEHTQTPRVCSSSRKTSIILKDNKSAKAKQQKIYKYLEVNNLLFKKIQSADNLIVQKDDQQWKQKRCTSREAVKQNATREGQIYKQISPKVTIQQNKMNVVFIQELNKQQISHQTKSPKSPRITDTPLFMHEMAQNGVLLKRPQTATSREVLNKGQINNRIPKFILSHHQNLIQSSGKQVIQSKKTKQYYNTITYL